MNILSFDVEDWFQGFKSRGIPGWEKYGSREQENVEKILNLLSEYNCKATFFVLGNFAEQNKGIVKQIHNAGHEIASHSYAHIPVLKMTPEKFREDLKRADDILTSIIGERIIGYRAPKWSINDSCMWALDILADEGYKYDSSFFPSSLHAFGSSKMTVKPCKINLENGKSIIEYPAQILSFAGLKIPAGGGFYLRVMPYKITELAFRKSNYKNKYGMVYLHPYEFDHEAPRLGANPAFRFMRYYNLKNTKEYLEKLLKNFEFTSIEYNFKKNFSGNILNS